jgi:hypothetical protein
MPVSAVSVSASRCTLALAVILLFSSHTFAQHSGGGGSGGGSSSGGGGGGGSHGGSSGGSASSGGGHGSGGGSSSHSSAGHSSSAGSGSSHPGTSHFGSSHSNTAHSNTALPTHQPSTGMRSTAQTPQKRGFFSFLRHHVPRPLPNPPEPKPEPKEPVAELRRPICFKGSCPVCPAGPIHGESGCEGTILRDRIRRICPAGEVWANGACLQQTWYQDECGGLRTMMDRQAQRMQAAEQDRQISCALGPWQQCSDSTGSAESEGGFYRELQNRYQACQRRSPTALPHNGFRVPRYSAGVSFDSLGMGLSRH